MGYKLAALAVVILFVSIILVTAAYADAAKTSDKPVKPEKPPKPQKDPECTMTNDGVEICDGVDNDCNNLIDDNIIDIPLNPLQDGVCAGTHMICDSGDFIENYEPKYVEYQEAETSCDFLDNDCDGYVDEEGVCGTMLLESGMQGKTRSYFFVGSKVASIAADEVNYYVTDHLGGTNRVYDQDGNLVSEVEYYAYGQDKLEAGEEQDYKYTGKEEDDSTGLYYYGARYYEPLSGRFLAIDKVKGDINQPQKLNRYSYTRNNPLKYMDPDGHDDKSMFTITVTASRPRFGPEIEMAADRTSIYTDWDAINRQQRGEDYEERNDRIISGGLFADSANSPILKDIKYSFPKDDIPFSIAHYDESENTVRFSDSKFSPGADSGVGINVHEDTHASTHATLTDSQLVAMHDTWITEVGSKPALSPEEQLYIGIVGGYKDYYKLKNMGTDREKIAVADEIISFTNQMIINKDPSITPFMKSVSTLSDAAKNNPDSVRQEFVR